MIVFLWKDGYNVRSSAVNHFNCTFDIFLCVCVNKYIAFTQVLCAQKITIVPPALLELGVFQAYLPLVRDVERGQLSCL